MQDVAVAMVIFNRPESTRRSFARIRAARPSKLFLIGDAPRAGREAEKALVQQSRLIAEAVDWPCEVRKIYAEENMGCARRISSGITQAFKEVDELIVLEDDCVAEPSFFGYCHELLDRYRTDERVMAISGNNFQKGNRRSDSSYYFSKYPHCWGWATWKRAWQHFQLDMPAWPTFRDQGHLASFCNHDIEIEYWTKIFNRVSRGEIDSWAYPWAFCCWAQHGLTAIPEVNLVSNIGFGEQSTHTRTDKYGFADTPAGSLESLVHPREVVRNVAADAFTDSYMFSRPQDKSRLMRAVRRSFPRSKRAA